LVNRKRFNKLPKNIRAKTGKRLFKTISNPVAGHIGEFVVNVIIYIIFVDSQCKPRAAGPAAQKNGASGTHQLQPASAAQAFESFVFHILNPYPAALTERTNMLIDKFG
jgi:hypothetical protein